MATTHKPDARGDVRSPPASNLPSTSSSSGKQDTWSAQSEAQLVDNAADNPGHKHVLVVYTGGTFGMQEGDTVEDSALRPACAPQLLRALIQALGDEEYQVERHTSQGYSSTESPPTWSKAIRLAYTFNMCVIDPLIDSSALQPEVWGELLRCIKAALVDNPDHTAHPQHGPRYESVIIIHGTDTLTYTAAALSFFVHKVKRHPIIVTGSQIPIFQHGNDAVNNFVGAMKLAHHWVPDVVVFFDGKVLHGATSVKINAVELDAFASPRHALLGHLRLGRIALTALQIEPVRERNDQRHPTQTCVLQEFNSDAMPRVLLIRLYPGFTWEVYDMAVLTSFDALVIEAFGVGNGPSGHTFVSGLKRLLDHVIVAIVTECLDGETNTDYATSILALSSHENLAGCRDTVTEAAFAKVFAYCMRWRTDGRKPCAFREHMCTSVAGELTQYSYH